jgi:hypothetical protein
MNSATLPTRQEINVYDSLDERSACEHFLGKTLEEAEALFRENSLYYQEDLMFMGVSAFRFYVQAAINYIQSESATGDGCIISCFASILEHRLEYEPQALVPVIPQLIAACRFITDHWDRFDVSSEIYAGLPERYLALERSLARAGREAGPE